MKRVVFYKCSVCGKIVWELCEGGGALVCCGREMTRLEPNSTDGADEKHVPVVLDLLGRIKVQVGEELHPFTPEHRIEWIALQTDRGVHFRFIPVGEKPKAFFKTDDEEVVAAYCYCNLHGLWMIQKEAPK